jgi:hypothetical protein
VVAGLDVLTLAVQLSSLQASGASHPMAPRLLLALAGRPALLVALGALALVALVQLARGKAQLAWGTLALLLLALLAESHAALVGGPGRSTFASGGMLLGWLVGLLWGRALDGTRRREDLAESAARAVLAATYVAAALSKLLAHGVRWADDTTLRAIVLSQHRVSDHGLLWRYTTWVVERPGVSQALAAATLAIQLSAVFLLSSSRSLRAASAALLLLFHLNVGLLTGIGYASNMLLLVIVAYPWPRLPSEKRDPEVERRVLIAALGAVVVLLVLAWLTPLRGYTLRHHRPM